MKNKFNLHFLFLILIVMLALFLRIYRLTEIPSGFFTDEASIGYNAYSLLKSGADEYGISFPLFFQAFGEYKSPIQIYSTIPFIALFGLNEFSVRLPSAIFGTFTILSIYLLTKEFFKGSKNNKSIALFAALFLAISPWHIHFSRVAFELMPFVFFTTTAVYAFLKSQNKPQLIPVTMILFVFALYSYFPARIFIPLFGITIFSIYSKYFLHHTKQTITGLLLVIIFLIPLVQHTLSPHGLERWKHVNVFSQLPENETMSVHILKNYISHFSLDFLFLKGDIDMPGQFIKRHSIHGMGELYFFQFPLIIAGISYLLKNKEKQKSILLFAWIILYPIGSMFTIDKNAQATRSIIGVIPFQILSAVGIVYLCLLASKLKRIFFSISILIFSGIIIFSLIRYFQLYFIQYPLHASDYWGWQYGYKNIVEEFKKQEKYYDQLLITHRFNYGVGLLRFYNIIYNCTKCISMTNPISIEPEKQQLFALRLDDITEANSLYNNLQFVKQKTIYLPNGKEEIFIGRFIKK